MNTDSTQPELPGKVFTDKAWNRVRHNGQLVRDELAADLPPKQCSAVWQQFKQMPIAQCACFLLSVLEPEAPAGLYRRNARRLADVGLFDDIPLLSERDMAKEIYAKLCERHSQRLSSCPWLLPILAGRARDLAVRPEAHGSEQGRRMRRIKGGIHVQQRYREQGWHPLPSVRKAWGLSEDRPEPPLSLRARLQAMTERENRHS
jgi:hypothetical protein